MAHPSLDNVTAELKATARARPVGRITEIVAGRAMVSGLSRHAALGDRVHIVRNGMDTLRGEVVALAANQVTCLFHGRLSGVGGGVPVTLFGPKAINPDESWLGRILGPDGEALDEGPLLKGVESRPLAADPPAATSRRGLGRRLSTGLAVFDTLLPVVRGQRVGLFAGSGVGKSSLLAQLALGVSGTDVIVIALVGERGREVRHFVENVLGPQGMKRTVVVAGTSDRSALERRRTLWTAMSIAEHFRDLGRHVLLLADSITRFAEAHREVALASGETANLAGFPPSTPSLVAALCERAGPGNEAQGDITSIFTVLVPASDMEDPVADMLRGTLDGHIVLDRAIAERGRFPAVDVLRSVSRALPDAATASENETITTARSLLGAYAQNEVMIRAGLYEPGTDVQLDAAVSTWPALDAFVGQRVSGGVRESFAALEGVLAGGRAQGNDG